MIQPNWWPVQNTFMPTCAELVHCPFPVHCHNKPVQVGQSTSTISKVVPVHIHDPDSCYMKELPPQNHKHFLRTCIQTYVFHLSQIPECKTGNQRFSELEGIRGSYPGSSVTDESTQLRVSKWLVWRYADKVFLIKNFPLLWINTCSLVSSPWREWVILALGKCFSS